jgi:NADH-quinone oxidoreductase subunit M
MGLLTLLVALPLIGAIALALLDADRDEQARQIAIGASTLTFVVSLIVLQRFVTGDPNFQMVETAEWIPAIGASWKLGIDGISLVLVLLTTLLTPLVLVSSNKVTDQVKGYLASFLVLEAAVIGVFLAMDLLLFYVFFEFTLIPMYLIIGIWGGANRRYAAIKFFLYTLFGGLLMLVAILWLQGQAGSFDYDTINGLVISPTAQRWLFGAFFVAFAVKIPLFPVHTWLPDAHTEAPTGGSVFLAGVLLKMGGYGLLRFSLPLFPDATQELALGTGEGFFSVPWLLIVSVIGILYGALVALVQKDIKKLVAYSSVSHMGFVVLGIFALNVTAASAGVVQMVNHGLSTGALFLLIGFLYDRRHTRMISAFGGLAKQTPIFAGIFLVVAMSSIALPGLNGFVGEFPILLGSYQTAPWAGTLAAFGAVLAALYLLWAYQRMFHGPLTGADNQNTTDLNRREIGVLAPLVILIVVIGLFPGPMYDRVTPSVERVLVEMGIDTSPLGSNPGILTEVPDADHAAAGAEQEVGQ